MVVMPVVDILANEIGNVSEEELDRDTKQFPAFHKGKVIIYT